MPTLFRWLALTFLSWLTLALPEVDAGEREYAVKAGFIYNFANYSAGDWFSAERSENYVICSFNKDFVFAASEMLKDQNIKGRKVKVDLIPKQATPGNRCNSFFLTDDNPKTLEKVLQNHQLKSSMLIGEHQEFIRSGGHLNLFIAGGKVRFEVNPQGLEKAGIKMSSKVLRMGRIIRGTDE